jgi:hypothetical protein
MANRLLVSKYGHLRGVTVNGGENPLKNEAQTFFKNFWGCGHGCHTPLGKTSAEIEPALTGASTVRVHCEKI